MASAELVSLQGWALFLTGQMAAAKTCADSHPIVPGSGRSAEGRLYALRALLASFYPGEAGAADLARAGLALLGEDDPVRALTLFALGTARLAQGDWHGAVETLGPALETARRTGQSMTAAASATMLGMGLVATGARPEAEALSREVIDGSEGSGSPAGPGTWFLAHWLLGLARYEAGDLVEARVELERGYAAVTRFAGLARQSLGAVVPYLALVRQATGSPEAVNLPLVELREEVLQRPHLFDAVLEPCPSLRLGEPPRNEHRAEKSEPPAPRDGQGVLVDHAAGDFAEVVLHPREVEAADHDVCE